jgi:glycosyltransferase involved in cell wall biosynthesis
VRLTNETTPLELSIVMPCLNEADTVGTCVDKAQRILSEHGIAGEVIVADNGSDDGSREIARARGARIVPVASRGYGHALMAGIAAARGRYVIMGDADDSYDFLEVPKFLDKLRAGLELVQGCRLPAGGGRVIPGAMPASHYWLGNPFFTALARRWFRAPIHDVYCGLRGFTKELYLRLDQRCTGMEFATEMIIKASLTGARIAEVSITLHPDGRKAHPPHLRTMRDGWRTLRFFLIYSPRWLFWWPGLALIGLGLVGYALALPGAHIGRANLDAHTLLVASLMILVGHQAVMSFAATKAFAMQAGLLPEDRRVQRFLDLFKVETALIVGGSAFAMGMGLILLAVLQWHALAFGNLDYRSTMRFVIPGTTLAALGVQTFFSGFLLSLLNITRRR